MGRKINRYKDKLFHKACSNNLGYNSRGYVDFIQTLKRNIDLQIINEKDATYILLEVLYQIKVGYIRTYYQISYNILDLVNQVRRINKILSETEKINEKNKLFNKNYQYEIQIVKEYIHKNFNLSNNPRNKFVEYEQEKILNSLKKVNYKNLCYIVNLDSDKQVLSETALRKSIVDILRGCYFDINNFDKLSIYQIKNILENNNLSNQSKNFIFDIMSEILINNNSKESKIKDSQDIFTQENFKSIKKRDQRQKKLNNKKKDDEECERQKELELKNKKRKEKELNDLLFNIKQFLNKDFYNQFSSKGEYEEIYRKIKNLNDFDRIQYSLFERFIVYYEHMDYIKEIYSYEDKFKQFNDLINNSIYLDYKERYSLIKKYEHINNILVNVDDSIINYLFDKINYFKEFFNAYSDLLNYTTFQETNNKNIIKIINKNFINNRIDENEGFFKDIRDYAKKVAIIMDDKFIKVIAGAGTGKTYTIQSKVKYLVEIMGVDPEKILCLCYTHKSASQLNERVNNSLKDSKVEVCTFHEFARRVDGACNGIKSTNRYLLDDIIRGYIKEVVKDENKSKLLLEYFTYYIVPQLGENEFKNYKDYDEGKKLTTLHNKYVNYGVENETLKGEFVRSLGEWVIANYLFMHEINYEYEQRYEKNYFSDFIKYNFLYSGHYSCLNDSAFNNPFNSKLKVVNRFIEWEKDRAKYKPDFYLTDYDIYLEHFAVDHNKEASWLRGMEKEKYESEMRSKQVWHKMYETNLIETYVYYLSQGRLIEELEKLLVKNKVKIGQRDEKEILRILIINSKVGDYNRFSNLIKSFINIFEANNLKKSTFDRFKSENNSEINLFTRRRQELFLDIVSEIYDRYYEYNQGNDIDHNREISNALELIKNKEYKRKFNYILIDEYQDINFIRCQLIKELQKNSDAKVFVVGDDWQSIYGFGGSSVDLFIDFEKDFPHAETIKLKENRRNSQKINDIACKFITKNKNQEKKKLEYYGKNTNVDPVKLVSYGKYQYLKILALDAILQHIINNNSKKDLKILILGRMKEDINEYVHNVLFKIKEGRKFKKIIYSKNQQLNITYMTIHQSKGLEYDEVIVLNLKNDIKGFPSQIEDDPILKFVKKENESFLFAEERRLFYVALTRTKNNVYLLYPEDNKSKFILELMKDFKLKESSLRKDYDYSKRLYEENNFFKRIERYLTELNCPECDEGKIAIIVDNNKNGRGKRSVFVSCSEKCGYVAGPYHSRIEDMKYIEKCPSCKGILVRQGNILKCSMNYHGGCMETKELKLDEEDSKYVDFED